MRVTSLRFNPRKSPRERRDARRSGSLPQKHLATETQHLARVRQSNRHYILALASLFLVPNTISVISSTSRSQSIGVQTKILFDQNPAFVQSRKDLSRIMNKREANLIPNEKVLLPVLFCFQLPHPPFQFLYSSLQRRISAFLRFGMLHIDQRRNRHTPGTNKHQYQPHPDSHSHSRFHRTTLCKPKNPVHSKGAAAVLLLFPGHNRVSVAFGKGV